MFEFSTKEQREAWRVIRKLSHLRLNWTHILADLDEAAARFDEREKTCGIEPLSEEHFALGVCSRCNYYWSWCTPNMVGSYLLKKELIKEITRENDHIGHSITDRGREVLANLNAMCKVEK